MDWRLWLNNVEYSGLWARRGRHMIERVPFRRGLRRVHTLHSALQRWLRVKDNGNFSDRAILTLVVTCYFASIYRKLPPSPRGHPIIGSLLDLRTEQWLKFTESREGFGHFVFSIFSWSIFNTDPTR